MHAYRCRAYCIYTYIGISAGSACLTTQSCSTTSCATWLSAKTAGDDVVGSAGDRCVAGGEWCPMTVRSHSTYPAALALPLGAPAGPSRSADARGSGPVYPDRPARSARSEFRVRRTATGVGRRWRRRVHSCTRPTVASPRQSLEVPRGWRVGLDRP